MKVSELLKTHRNWMKGGRTNGKGRYCLLGAIEHCATSGFEKLLNISALKKLMPNGCDSYECPCSIVAFNDNPKTTFKDIRELIEKAGI